MLKEWKHKRSEEQYEAWTDILKWYSRIFIGAFWLLAFNIPLIGGERFESVGMFLIYLPISMIYDLLCLTMMREYNNDL